MHRWIRIAVAILTAILASCGGGGGGGLGGTCSNGDVAASFKYHPPIRFRVGEAVSFVPEIHGVPASCQGSMRFVVSSGKLPPGLRLNDDTGLISGKPDQAGMFNVTVRLTLDDLQGQLETMLQFAVTDTAGAGIAAWEVMTDGAPFLGNFRIAAIDETLFVVTGGASDMATFRSDDAGATWTQLRIPGPRPPVHSFALASDGRNVYMSGGRTAADTPTNAVWRFDGASWTQVTDAAAFPKRSGHAMLSHGRALYVLGGQGRGAADTYADTWRSIDGGATWIRASAGGFAPRTDFCAVGDGSRYMYVTGGAQHDADPDNALVRRSTDGVTWTPLPVPANSPLPDVYWRNSSTTCAFLDGRIVVMTELFEGFGALSSSDGVDWAFEPPHYALDNLSPGAVTAGGRIYVTAGAGTSQRWVIRSQPRP